MKNKKDEFKKLVSNESTDTINKNRDRIKNRETLRESQRIAMMVLNKLDELGWTQRKLAQKMGVTPQQVTKIVKGKENHTLDTQVKLQTILDIPILASYYEQKPQDLVELKITDSYDSFHLAEFNLVEEKDLTIISRKSFQKDYNKEEYNHYSRLVS